MFLFLYLIFPLLCAGCFVPSQQKYKGKLIAAVCTGASAALLYCAARQLFFLERELHTASFGLQFLYFLLRFSVLPPALLYGVYAAVSTGSAEDCRPVFLPLTASFYAVYLPYCLSGSLGVSFRPFFVLFLMPLLYAQMLFMLSWILEKWPGVWRGRNMRDLVLLSAATLAALCMPALACAVWYYGLPVQLQLIPVVLNTALAAVLAVLQFR